MSIKERIYPLYLRYFLPLQHRNYCCCLRHKKNVNVCFIVSSLPMWRAQELYELLRTDSRFNVQIGLCPFASFSKEERQKNLSDLILYFDQRQIPYVDFTTIEDPGVYLRNVMKPDLIFYPQHYYNMYQNGIDSEFFKEKLLCYIPYGLNTVNTPWAFNQKFNSFAWRQYYSTHADLKSAQRWADNHGKNIRIVGNPMADIFLHKKDSFEYPWKKQSEECIKIIWAPHYSINEGFFHRSSFLALHDWMLQFAEQTKGKAQFVFKPHPKLISILYEQPDWGKERTDAYYKRWADGENTQLETGAYVDLFLSSDAMIHDCVSFTAEYFYAQKPVLFYSENFEATKKDLNDLGLAALSAHYKASSPQDLESFFNQVLVEGHDSKKDEREAVRQQYLIPPGGKSVAENIYNDIIDSIWP